MLCMDLVRNKKATFNYEILEKFEAGLELFGHEVKSLRAHHGSLEGAHVIARGREAFIVGLNIPPYQPANTPEGYEPERTRKLLLTKKEINQLTGWESKKGFTIVPLSIFGKGRFIKISIAIAKGKKKFDKRESIKKRATERSIRREISS